MTHPFTGTTGANNAKDIPDDRGTSAEGGPVRPSDTPEVVARYRSAIAQRSGEDVAVDALADLWRIDTMITENIDRSRTVRSALVWTLPVVTVAAALFTAGALALGNGVALTVVGLLVIFAGLCSGALALTHLWSGALLHRRALVQDDLFRREVGGLLTESPVDNPVHVVSTRAELLHALEDILHRRR